MMYFQKWWLGACSCAVLLACGESSTASDAATTRAVVGNGSPLIAASALDTTPTAPQTAPSGTFSYNITTPNVLWDLSNDLIEISGIDFHAKHGLVAVQDETGILYFLSPQDGKVVRKVKFAGEGDFEAVRFVGSSIWVLHAGGILYRLDNWEQNNPDVTKFQLPMDEENDPEGLAFDAKHNRLLIACKNSASLQEKVKDRRAIYAFDLATNTLNETPVYSFTVQMVQQYIAANPDDYTQADVVEKLKKGKVLPIMPSEAAIHPVTNDIYILAATGFAVVVLSPEGKLLRVAQLDEKIFVQAEGLAFLPNGDMLISSEARFNENTAKIGRFDWKK